MGGQTDIREEPINAMDRVATILKKPCVFVKLKLNTDKTEVIVFSSKQNEQFVGDISVTVGTSQIRNLGAYFDSRMNMESHINAVCQSSYAQLRHIGHIRQYITGDATQSRQQPCFLT